MKEKTPQYQKTKEIPNKIKLWQPPGIYLFVFQDLENIKAIDKSYCNYCPC